MSLIIAMFSFSLAMSLSPGPVNMIILSSGVNYGVKKTIPYVSGATIGFTLLLLVIGLGLFEFIKVYPSFLNYLALGGSLYIGYIGYKIASSLPQIESKPGDLPKFHQGFMLQWVNPKAWIACISGVSLFSSVESNAPFLTFALIYFLVCYGSLALWAILGDRLSTLLNSTVRLRLFNIVLGAMLIATALYLLYSQNIMVY